jgi:lysophospholipase L1-like esterase
LKTLAFPIRIILLSVGLMMAGGCDVLQKENPGEPSPIGSLVHYDALGASDTIGYGGSSPCPLFPLEPCTSGPGYVQQVTRRLQLSGKEVILNNLGVPGAVLSPETQASMQAMNGCEVAGYNICRNVLVDEAPYVRRSSTLVTVFIGANDANAMLRVIRAGQATGGQTAYVQAQIEKFARDMQTMVATVRSRSPEARIVVLNLPNMGNTPYAAALPVSEKRVLQQLTVGFSGGINALAGQGVAVVDLLCDANFYNPAIFSADGFHPNDAGYTYLTDLVFAATTTPAAPRASCSFMTVF